MKFRWFPFTALSIKARLFLTTSLVVAAVSLLALVFGFFTKGIPSTRSVLVPLFTFLLSSAVSAVQLYRLSFSLIKRFIHEAEAAHPDLFCSAKGSEGLSFLTEYVRKTEEKLKDQKDEAGTLRKRLLALSAVTAALNQDLEEDQLLNDVLGTVLEVTEFDGGMIFLHSEESHSWDIRAWRGLQLESMWGADRAKAGPKILEETFRCRRVIFISDVEHSRQQHIQEFRDKGIKTILAIPFVAKKYVCGAALLVDFEAKETSLEEEELLEAIGRQLGMAIIDARLLSESTAKMRDLSLIVEVSSAFSVDLDLESIMKTLSRKMLKALDADFCHTALVDSEGSHLTFEAFSSTRKTVSPIRPGEKINLNQLPLYQKVITNKKMLRIRGKGQLASSERQLIDSRETGEVILIPLATEEKALGVIGVGLRRPDDPNSERLDMGRSIAQHAASALERAQLYHNVKEKADELSSLYQMAQKLSSILDWDELLDQILKVVVDSFGYLNSAVLLVDPRKNELYVKAAHGFPASPVG
jgi:GAF domain-containing protein